MNRNSLRSSSHVQGGFSRQLEFRPHSPYQFGKLNRVNLAPPLPLLIPTSWINQFAIVIYKRSKSCQKYLIIYESVT